MRLARSTAREASRSRHPSVAGRPRAERVLPLAPLLEASGLTLSGLSRRVHRSRADLSRADLEGLSLTQACDWADRVGLFPSEVWGEAFFAVAGEVAG